MSILEDASIVEWVIGGFIVANISFCTLYLISTGVKKVMAQLAYKSNA